MHSQLATSNAWANLPDIGDARPLSDEDAPLVADLVAVLKKHDALSRFGLTLLHKHFDLNDGEILVEDTDVEGRNQKIYPQKADDILTESVTVTAWRLDTGTPTMSCVCVKKEWGHSHHPR